MERNLTEILRQNKVLRDIVRCLENQDEINGRGDNAVRDSCFDTGSNTTGFGLVVFASNCVALQGRRYFSCYGEGTYL